MNCIDSLNIMSRILTETQIFLDWFVMCVNLFIMIWVFVQLLFTHWWYEEVRGFLVPPVMVSPLSSSLLPSL